MDEVTLGMEAPGAYVVPLLLNGRFCMRERRQAAFHARQERGIYRRRERH